jgi:hypothetical protein
VDFFLGLQIEKAKGARRKHLLYVSILSNVGTLFIFKYYNFFVNNFEAIAPVNRSISANNSGRFFLNDSKCCSTKGFVGAKNNTFFPGNFFSLSTDNIKAIRVLPVPVAPSNVIRFLLSANHVRISSIARG